MLSVVDTPDPPALVLARCPFCNDTFPAHIVTDHCNHCVDYVGLVEEARRQRRAVTDSQAADAKTKGNVSGGVASTLRGMVSQNKVRFQEDGFDLDLTYITPRLIAMGFPSHGTEGYYRNPIEEVERFFESRHKGHYRIYNLCSERQYDHAGRFNRSFRCFPFDDHNAPAPITLIPAFCEDAAEWLNQHSQNVIAVHCKAGKGRTGVMVAAYLMFSNTSLRKADDALKAFGDCRTHDGKGVTIPSQIRYVRYWETMLTQYNRSLPQQRPVRVDKIVVHGSIRFGGCDPYFQVLRGPDTQGEPMKEIFDSRKRFLSKHVQRDGGFEWDLVGMQNPVVVTGDIKFVFKAKGKFISEDHLFHFWINTAFVAEHLKLDKKNLDKASKDTKHDTYREDLAVEANFVPLRKTSGLR